MGIIQTLLDDFDHTSQEELAHIRRVMWSENQLAADIRAAKYEIEATRPNQWIYIMSAQFAQYIRRVVAAYENHAAIEDLPVFAYKIQVDTWQNRKQGFSQGGVHIALAGGIDQGRLFRTAGETLCTRSRRGIWDYDVTDRAVTCKECQRIADRLRRGMK